MQTTVPIEGSSEGDDAAHARETCVGGVANADTSNSSSLPDALSDVAFAALTRELRRECASIDMPAPGSALDSKGYASVIAISGPATCTAAQNSRDG